MVVLELESPSSPGGGEEKTPSASDAAGLGWSPGIGSSSNLPGVASADGWMDGGHTLRNPGLEVRAEA